MPSSGAVRPAAGRVLQQLTTCKSGSSRSSMALPLRTPAMTPSPRQSAWRHQRLFSTTAPATERKRTTRDNNRLRGVSSLYRSGLREPLSVSDEPLPEPDLSEGVGRMQEKDNDPDHGLWHFFYDKRLLPTPDEDKAHGRAWTREELRAKSWDDLHALWWLCCRERNRIATSDFARQKKEIGFGSFESQTRDRAVLHTMSGIKAVLTERFYAWEDARKLAKDDPEVDLSGNGPIYTPSTFMEPEEESFVEEEEFAASEATEEAIEKTAATEPTATEPVGTAEPATTAEPAAAAEEAASLTEIKPTKA